VSERHRQARGLVQNMLDFFAKKSERGSIVNRAALGDKKDL